MVSARPGGLLCAPESSRRASNACELRWSSSVRSGRRPSESVADASHLGSLVQNPACQVSLARVMMSITSAGRHVQSSDAALPSDRVAASKNRSTTSPASVLARHWQLVHEHHDSAAWPSN
jgi:hypothetical protein